MKLILGVIDLPYVEQRPARVLGQKRPKAQAAHTSTGKVAAILEAKYSVMENFAALHQQDIAELFAASLSETIEALALGAPADIDPYGRATSETELLFRDFLDREEIAETGQEGVPTKAARAGVNHRMKVKKGNPRPSFIDTGLYQSSFKAWAE